MITTNLSLKEEGANIRMASKNPEIVEIKNPNSRKPTSAQFDRKKTIFYDPDVGVAEIKPGQGTRWSKKGTEYTGIIRPYRTLGHEIRHFLAKNKMIPTPMPQTKEEKMEAARCKYPFS